MRKYEKPAISVIGLQLKENIAAVPTTVYKGNAGGMSNAVNVDMVLSAAGTGLEAKEGLVVPS